MDRAKTCRTAYLALDCIVLALILGVMVASSSFNPLDNFLLVPLVMSIGAIICCFWKNDEKNETMRNYTILAVITVVIAVAYYLFS